MYNTALFLVWMVVALSALVLVYRLFGQAGLVAIIAGNVVIMNVLVTKNVVIFGIGATAANVLYGMIFLSTDIISEFEGGAAARKAVFMGFTAGVVALAASMVTLWLVPAPWDWAQESLVTILSPMARIVAGSWLAYLLSQTFDTFAYDFWKNRGFPIWVRNNGSTMVSQALDTLVFCTVGLLGLMPVDAWIQIVISTYVLKVIVAASDTPFIYLAARLRKDG